MEIIRRWRCEPVMGDGCGSRTDETAGAESAAVALGFFDGVHLGHRALLERTVRLARETGTLPCAFTFSGDAPAGKDARFLTDEATRFSRIADCGIVRILAADFEDVRRLTPEAFVREVLIGALHARQVLCGFNYRFGADRAGDGETLCRLMREAGGEAIVLPPATDSDGTVISSSRIRAAIEAGDMQDAARLMGAPYALTAPVLHGKALGRTAGIPTANQRFPAGAVIPAHGVYATLVRVGERDFPGVTNVGTRPTVDGTGVNCETNLIGFSGDLYGETVCVSFGRRLRGEIRFENEEALWRQIRRDRDEVKREYGIQ